MSPAPQADLIHLNPSNLFECIYGTEKWYLSTRSQARRMRQAELISQAFQWYAACIYICLSPYHPVVPGRTAHLKYKNVTESPVVIRIHRNSVSDVFYGFKVLLMFRLPANDVQPTACVTCDPDATVPRCSFWTASSFSRKRHALFHRAQLRTLHLVSLSAARNCN